MYEQYFFGNNLGFIKCPSVNNEVHFTLSRNLKSSNLLKNMIKENLPFLMHENFFTKWRNPFKLFLLGCNHKQTNLAGFDTEICKRQLGNYRIKRLKFSSPPPLQKKKKKSINKSC